MSDDWQPQRVGESRECAWHKKHNAKLLASFTCTSPRAFFPLFSTPPPFFDCFDSSIYCPHSLPDFNTRFSAYTGHAIKQTTSGQITTIAKHTQAGKEETASANMRPQQHSTAHPAYWTDAWDTLYNQLRFTGLTCCFIIS